MQKIVLSVLLSLSVVSCNAGPILAATTYGAVRLACILPAGVSTILTVVKSREADEKKQHQKASTIRVAGGTISVVSGAGAFWGSHVVAAAAAKLAFLFPGI